MAKLYIREYAGLPKVADDQIAPIPGELVAEQNVAIGATSAASSVFNGATRYIEVSADVDCHVTLGETPVATTDNGPLWAKQWHPFVVKRGEKIAVIEAA